MLRQKKLKPWVRGKTPFLYNEDWGAGAGADRRGSQAPRPRRAARLTVLVTRR